MTGWRRHKRRDDPRAGARGSRRSLREASLLLDAKRVFGSRTLHRTALWPFASTACYSPVLGGERRVNHGDMYSVTRRTNWPTSVALVVPMGIGLALGFSMEYNFGQAMTFAVALVLFTSWILSQGGSAVGILTESNIARAVISFMFLAALILFLTGILEYGSFSPNRPFSLFMVMLVFLPYGISTMLDIILRN